MKDHPHKKDPPQTEGRHSGEKGTDRELGQVRREYGRETLDESVMPEDPLELFSIWLDHASGAGCQDPTAMTLSTVERNGQPSSRVVLLKKIENGRMIFYTNYHSRKAREIRTRPKVAALFYWSELERQVKIAGTARPVDDGDSDSYFQSRPRESNICAWASPQSEVIPDRRYLEQEFEKYSRRYRGLKNIPRPAYWGGYAITPIRMEFWQGGIHRLHDRIQYTLKEERWFRERLAP